MGIKIKLVPRNEVRVTKRSSSKFRQLLDALDKLEPGGMAIEVGYEGDKELNSMRNVVYTYARERGIKVKSGKDAINSRIFFFKEK
jgi:tRNA splicing endonuclease